MKIVIASGKGGTGKTTVATNLATVFASKNFPASYCDCDVEAPNGHIFLKPEIEHSRIFCQSVPQVNHELCDGCGDCSKICRFSAIVVIRRKVLTFPELCHSCGGCSLVCPLKAIEEVNREVGIVETGTAGKIKYVAGKLNIGEASAVQLIRKVKNELDENGISVIDAPPGTSCPVIETMRGGDYVLLVTEPTPFGLNDLRLAVETVRKLEMPLSVVINRSDIGDSGVETYCRDEGIEVIARIPYSRDIAEAYSKGSMLVNQIPNQLELYSVLADRLMERVSSSVAV
ncbi:MAG: ATP-binding protein [Candidatus Electryonea clarkiae]|nr:ATP-binding protein [Candidatus Electryonea clarkiae]MDP8287642.1 ATP-binding protein [Candidatus Electryonea clarkiae]